MSYFGRVYISLSLLTVSALLAACQGGTSSQELQSANDKSDKPVPAKVSLFGVRIGMTVDELNATFPGAHCAPTSAHPTCEIPNQAMGAGGIGIRFNGNQVDIARTDGQTRGGTKAVAKVITLQLGLPTDPGTPNDPGESWIDADGSNLTLLNMSSADGGTYNSAAFSLGLYSHDAWAEAARSAEETHHKQIANLAATLKKALAIGADGSMSICGARVGSKYSGQTACMQEPHIRLVDQADERRCASALLTPQPLPRPGAKQKPQEPPPDGCIHVFTDDATRQVKSVTVFLPTAHTTWDAVREATTSLENAGKLKDLSHWYSGAEIPWYLNYQNTLGDRLTVVGHEESWIPGLGSNPVILQITLAGQVARNATFR